MDHEKVSLVITRVSQMWECKPLGILRIQKYFYKKFLLLYYSFNILKYPYPNIKKFLIQWKWKYNLAKFLSTVNAVFRKKFIALNIYI